jgi:hypothetical protein
MLRACWVLFRCPRAQLAFLADADMAAAAAAVSRTSLMAARAVNSASIEGLNSSCELNTQLMRSLKTDGWI